MSRLMATRLRRIALATCVVLIPSVWAGSGLWENLHPVIEGELYRSARPTPAMLARVQEELGIRTVVNLCAPWPDKQWYLAERETAQSLGLAFHDIDMATYRLAPLREVRRLIEIYDTAPKPILIHCQRGADRSALAAAIFLILKGRSIEEALEQYSIRFGHTGLAFGKSLPHLFDVYRDWLKLAKLSHSPDAFRQWLIAEPAAGYFTAVIQPVSLPPTLSAERATSIDFSFRNASRYPWEFRAPPESGIHAVVRILTDTGDVIHEQACPAMPCTVQPGESIIVPVVVPWLDAHNRYQIYVDLEDEFGCRFYRMGVGGWRTTLSVAQTVASEATNHRER